MQVGGECRVMAALATRNKQGSHMASAAWVPGFASEVAMPKRPRRWSAKPVLAGSSPAATSKISQRMLARPYAPALLAAGSVFTSIFRGNAAAEIGALISSTPLRYSAVTLSLSTPSGSSICRWNDP